MPKRVDKAARKQEIAGAALSAIAERGLEGVRMVDIARASGATTGQLVHYYEDKDAMLLAALEEIVERLTEWIAEPVPVDDLFEAFIDALPIHADSQRDWRIWVQFWGRAIVHPSLGRVHEAYYERITTALAGALAAHVPKGKARDLADAISAAVDGIGIRATLEPTAWPPERQRRLLRQMLRPLMDDAKDRPPRKRRQP